MTKEANRLFQLATIKRQESFRAVVKALKAGNMDSKQITALLAMTKPGAMGIVRDLRKAGLAEIAQRVNLPRSGYYYIYRLCGTEEAIKEYIDKALWGGRYASTVPQYRPAIVSTIHLADPAYPLGIESRPAAQRDALSLAFFGSRRVAP